MSKLSASQRGVRANREGITGNLIDTKAGGGHCLRCDCSRRPAIRTERQAAEPSPTKRRKAKGLQLRRENTGLIFNRRNQDPTALAVISPSPVSDQQST